jgi:cytochrome bd ubiquinol oxidase subunit I
MELDPVFLSRLQFAFVVAFHILLPAFTIGLAAFIVVLEGLYLFKRDQAYLRLSLFWVKIFAVSFGMGVVSGIVMPFQFGTNWSEFADATANVTAPLLGYEGLTAFFLEAGFLGIMLFGRKLVPQWVHFFASVMVASGTLLSAFWILAVNSWMQTPAGYEIVDGRFFPADWIAVIFNPSFPYRFAHTVTAFMVTTGFVVVGVAAYYLRHGKHVVESRTMMSMTLWLLSLSVPLQFVIGDSHGLNTLAHQPVKIAAMEGLWDTEARAPMVLFAIPDEATEANRYEIAIPALASIYLTHDIDGVVQGMKETPRADRPPVIPVFFAFRVMVGVGVLMLGVVVWSWWLRARGRLFESRLFLGVCQAMTPLGFVAVVAGWIVTEVGRQPWVVYGMMRTSEAVSPSLTGGDVVISLILYMAVYAVVFGAGLYYLVRVVRGGPPDTLEAHEPELQHRPARPLSAADAGG